MAKEPIDRSKGKYKVGYRKPPKQHQFKSGSSGNPRGRPPKVRRSNAEIYAEMFGGDVTILRDGKQIEVPFLEAMFLQLRNGMLKAKPKDQLQLLMMMQKQRLLQLDDEYRELNKKLAEDRYALNWGFVTPDVQAMIDEIERELGPAMEADRRRSARGRRGPDDADEAP